MKKACSLSCFIVALVFGWFLTQGAAPLYAQLDISPPAKVVAKPGDTITVPLTLTNPSGTQLDALGLTFFYPTALLTYDTIKTTGTLTANWTFFNAFEVSPGRINMGGFQPLPPGITQSGVLVNVVFIVKSDTAGIDTLKLRNFLDDLATATTKDGIIVVPAETVFLSVLSGAQEVPPVTATASGGGMFVLNARQTELAFNIRVTGLSGAITGAHFHLAATGKNGPVVRTITSAFVGEVASGIWKDTDTEALTPALVDSLLAGKIYINIHTAANPTGEIRAQVVPGKEMKLAAALSGDQEVPPVVTSANGVGVFTLDSTGSNLKFDIAVNGLSGPVTGANFHNAPKGVNGPAVRNFTRDFAENIATGIWSKTDPEPLTSALVAELLAGTIYVNIQTQANPLGEIRGQIGKADEVVFLSVLSGDQEVPPDTNKAIGGARFVLNAERTELAFLIKVGNLSGPITGAHFHRAPAGANGPVVRTITSAFTDTTATGVWKSTDTEPLTAELVAELLSGNLYVNIHTAANPTGEIRGQLRSGVAIDLAAQIEGAQEVPPVTTTAAGFGTFTLNPAGTELAFTAGVTGLSGPISGAHFHNAGRGKNGPVVRTITNDFVGKVAKGVWKNTDLESLTPELVVDLLIRNIYVNIHTAAHPAGEIRGQVEPGAKVVAPIGVARQLADNTPKITIEGIITSIDFGLARTTDSEYYLQDATGGIRMFVLAGKAVLPQGTRVRVVDGTIVSNAARKTIEAQKDSIKVIDSPGLPAPQVVTVAFFVNNRADIEGEHIRINNTNITGAWPAAGSSATLKINDGSGDLDLRIDNDTDIDGSPQPLNPVDIIGVATSFNAVLQLQPSARADFLVTTTFLATLSGDQEVPPVTTTAKGGGMFVLNPDHTELSYNLSVTGLSGAITGAHFHVAAAGRNGPVVRAITFTGEVASGIWKSTDGQALTPALVDSLLAGKIYVNVHTAANPAGEIRGQLLSGVPVRMAARLEGKQEVPPVTTAAGGFGSFTLNADGTELAYQVGVIGLSSAITGAHFHYAGAGTNGPIVRTITTDFVNNFATGVWKKTDAQPLTPDLVVKLLASQIYVNIHTAANPGGEIRGQVVPGATAVVPIGLSRQLADSTRNVTIEGVVTTIDFQLSSAANSEYYLQDATGGIRAFIFNGKAKLTPGTLVRAKAGMIATNRGRKNIEVVAANIDSLGFPGLPTPRLVTVAFYLANRPAVEGQYIRINYADILGTFPAVNTNATISIKDSTGTLALFIDRDTDIDGSPQPRNPVHVLGVATSFDGTPQIQPSSTKDFIPTVGVDSREEALPKVFSLAQNYPNPFNPTTIIRYDLPKNVHVKLVIYNLLGERVRTLVDEDEAAGFKHITWDGTNEFGVRVASGVYLYRIEAGTFVATRKLMVMK